MTTTPPPGFYFFITVFWLVVACTVLMVLFKVAVWWGERHETMSSDKAWEAPVRAGSRTGSTAGSTGSRDLVLGHTHQLEPREPGESEPGETSFARQLAREELIIMLAVQRKADGDYLYSANDITKFVGGTAAPVKNTIANVRGRKETPPPAKSLQRPLNGW